MSILNNSLLLAAPAGSSTYQITRSLRFSSGDSSYLSRTPSVAGNRQNWTWSGWVKRSNPDTGVRQVLFSAYGASNDTGYFEFGFDSGANLGKFYWSQWSVDAQSAAVFRDFSAWYHILVNYNGSNIVVYVNGTSVLTSAKTGDLAINGTFEHGIGRQPNSGRYFSGYIADPFFIDGQALDPSSFTTTDPTTGQLIPKAYSGSGYGTNGFHLPFSDNSATTATTLGKDTSGNSNNWTPNNLAVTGSSTSTTGNISLGSTARNFYFKGLVGHQIGCASGNHVWDSSNGSSWTYRGLSGSTVTLTSTYLLLSGNTNISFTNTNSDLVTYWDLGLSVGVPNGTGTTYTWNVNAYGEQNIDSLVDTPSSAGTDSGLGGQVTGNYCTLNPLAAGTTTLSNGNLDVVTNNAHTHVRGTIGVTSGKWYWEITPTGGTTTESDVGIVNASASFSEYIGQNANGWGYYATGNKYNGSGAVAYGASYTLNDVIGVALDADAGTLTFYKNGTTQGQAFSGLTSGPYFPAVSDGGSTNSVNFSVNFGQRPFAYPVSGFKALCDTNLAPPLVAKGSTVMDVLTWTGNSASSRALTGLGFSPDFVWIKDRSNGYNHVLFDAVRGAGGSKVLFSNRTTTEGGGAGEEGTNYGAITSFDSSGFTVAPGAVNSVWVNQSSDAYAAWCWDAGTSTVTNTQGSITSSVRANASAGFSVVAWTKSPAGAHTVGHGLGVAPQLVIVKSRSLASEWAVYHSALGATKFLKLNTTDAAGTVSAYWNDTAPTSTTISLGSWSNLAGDNIAYCFAPVTGYNNGFSYTGNGSTDGPFCFLGFRPRLILLKVSNTTGPWYLFDTARNTYNVMNNRLEANSSSAEASDRNVVDALSNGFKLRDVDAVWNQSGNTYIGFAWAESPFQYARAR